MPGEGTMRLKAPALLVIAMMTLSPLVSGSSGTARAANENGDTFVAVPGYAFSTSPLHIGDHNVTLSITVRNLRQGDGNASNGDERLHNVTLDVLGVEDPSGRLLQPPASPLVWDVSSIDNDGDGYTLGFSAEPNSSRSFTGLLFDVKGVGVRPGSYNVSIRVHYLVMTAWNPLETQWSAPLSEDLANIRFDVVSNVAVGTPVVFTDAMDTTSLYAGASFQLIGVPVRTLSGTLDKVVGTLSVPPGSPFQPVISPGTSPEATIERITGTSFLCFRLEVPVTDPGIYDATNANITLALEYVRQSNWNGRVENTPAAEDGLPLTFTLDYTPLLNATGASPAQITRGTQLQQLTVGLLNEGNADLVRLRVVLEAEADFSPADYHYDGNGNRVPGPAEFTLDSLESGQNATAVFRIAMYPNVPPGIHRLGLSYSGYLHNTGMTGASSGYYPVTDDLFQQLRGALPYIDVEVVSTRAALELTSSPSPSAPLNPDGQSEGQTIGLRVRNDEHFSFLDARFTVLAGDGTALRNPSDRSARALETLTFPSFGPGVEQWLEFWASLNSSLQPGLYPLTMRFNGTSADSGQELSFEERFFICTGPFGPKVTVESASSAQLGVRTKGVTLPVKVQNAGGTTLEDVALKLACGPGTPILDPASPSAPSMRMDIGRLYPGVAAQVELVVDLDSSAEARTYSLGVELSGGYLGTGELFTRADNITLKVLGAPPLLVVLNASAAPGEIIPGKAFTLTFTVKNIGGERARGVWVGLQGLAGAAGGNASSGTGASGLAGEVPFSADIAVRYIGDLNPGQEVNLTFSMQSDAWAGRGRTYQQPVQLWYQDQANAGQFQQFPLAVRTKAAAAPAEPAKDWMPTILLLVLIIVVVVALAVLLAPRRAAKPAPAAPAPATKPGTEQPADEAATQVALAMPMQTPPPPPPGYGSMAASQPLPPPPPPPESGEGGGIPTAPVYAPPSQLPPPPPPPSAAKATRVEGGTGTHAGPLEGYSIPGAEADQPRYSAPPQKPRAYSGKEVPMRTCPTCGNEVKVRFVKCPYCGSDLPPVT